MTNYRATRPVSTVVVAFNGRVFGLDPVTGGTLWEQQVGSPYDAVALVVTESAIYAATPGMLACLLYPTGSLVWSVDTRWLGRPSLMLDGDRLILAKTGTVECYSLSGERLWENGFKGKGKGAIAMGVPGFVVQSDETA